MNNSIQNIGKEWLADLPKHWSYDRLKDLCEKITGGGTPKSNISEYWEDGDIVWVSPTDFGKQKGIKYISTSEKKITELGLQKSSASMLPVGTVIMSSRASIGEPKIANAEMCTNQGFISFITNHKLHNNFLFYLIDCQLGDYYLKIASGTTFMEISSRMAKQENVPLPPPTEQKAIADYLDKATEKIDSVIVIKQQQLIKMQEIRKSAINKATRFGKELRYNKKKLDIEYLPEINSEWKYNRFKDVASLRTEKSNDKSEIEDYIELEDLSQGTGVILNKRNTLEVASKVTKFYTGDVLFGKLRPYLEKYAFANFDGKCTGEILAFEPKKIEGKYLMYILASKWFINLCNSMSYGAKMPRVNWNTQLSKVYLPLPTPEVQKDIVSHLDKLMEKDRRQVKILNSQIKTLKAYRKSLIFECVTGKKQVMF